VKAFEPEEIDDRPPDEIRREWKLIKQIRKKKAGRKRKKRKQPPLISGATLAYVMSLSPREFYACDEWRYVRYEALLLNDGRCECCGRGKHQGIILHVDHIKPRSRYPALQLRVDNLQVLCIDCNMGKQAWDETDWRKPVSPPSARS